MNITVYLGATKGKNPNFELKCKELGAWIAKEGHTLIYGGSKTGLMGVLAESAITNGGKAIGVEPQFFIDAEAQYDNLTELIVTKDMNERKNKMIELGDAFIAFPGGTGTLEEISEVISKTSLKQLHVPCIFYNIDGFYNPLKSFFENLIKEGLSTENRLECVHFANNIEEIASLLDNVNK